MPLVLSSAEEFHAFAARWGGDEFVVAISGENPVQPEKVQQRIAECVNEHTQAAGIEYALSVSVGMAKCTSPDTKLTELVSEADTMLYKNKRTNLDQAI